MRLAGAAELGLVGWLAVRLGYVWSVRLDPVGVAGLSLVGWSVWLC
ncbi:hypothetical protein KGQ20_44360 [Catenulispora sp. NF23]|nr:hypothetical protein [Catenulispora pinistramenti]MBS2539798.1 hypothetical protein [Catenulispora pinistramenti]